MLLVYIFSKVSNVSTVFFSVFFTKNFKCLFLSSFILSSLGIEVISYFPILIPNKSLLFSKLSLFIELLLVIRFKSLSTSVYLFLNSRLFLNCSSSSISFLLLLPKKSNIPINLPLSIVIHFLRNRYYYSITPVPFYFFTFLL